MEDELLVEPPNYYTDDPKEHIFDICFHPKKDYISYGNIYGEAKM
jgi:hypothetical protein